jgi:uracil-DNA glycosylase
MRPLLIGEAPAATTPQGWPAFYGRERSAKRLWELGFRVSRSYDSPTGNVDATNLLEEYPGRHWPLNEAKVHARFVLFEDDSIWRRPRVILVGRNVADAFGALQSWGWFEWFRFRGDRETEFALMPHPSGLNRWWNETENVKRARAFVEKLLGRQGRGS